mmetsp:Transcript_13293/g.32542  ORF Transcript_13293/g.32542 Transcript_13293/m.32542 type:complete len:302 (+) Transcript_13293:3065-3970(+)
MAFNFIFCLCYRCLFPHVLSSVAISHRLLRADVSGWQALRLRFRTGLKVNFKGSYDPLTTDPLRGIRGSCFEPEIRTVCRSLGRKESGNHIWSLWLGHGIRFLLLCICCNIRTDGVSGHLVLIRRFGYLKLNLLRCTWQWQKLCFLHAPFCGSCFIYEEFRIHSRIFNIFVHFIVDFVIGGAHVSRADGFLHESVHEVGASGVQGIDGRRRRSGLHGRLCCSNCVKWCGRRVVLLWRFSSRRRRAAGNIAFCVFHLYFFSGPLRIRRHLSLAGLRLGFVLDSKIVAYFFVILSGRIVALTG